MRHNRRLAMRTVPLAEVRSPLAMTKSMASFTLAAGAGSTQGMGGMFEAGDTGRGKNVFGPGMGNSGPSDMRPSVGLNGFWDEVGELWDKGVDTVTTGANTLFTANVDSYVQEHIAPQSTNPSAPGYVAPVTQSTSPNAAGYVAPQGKIAQALSDNPLMGIALGLSLFKMFIMK